MSRLRPSAAAAFLALCAIPAGLSAPPALAELPPSPAALALRVAVAATSADLAGEVGELPQRARLEVRRAGAAALAPLRPPEALAPALARLRAWREHAGTLASAATTLRRVTHATGGPVATADRALDAAALAAVAAFALQLALRRRAPRR